MIGSLILAAGLIGFFVITKEPVEKCKDGYVYMRSPHNRTISERFDDMIHI